MSGWEAVRSLQQFCLWIKGKESEWSKLHFSELKSPKWILLSRQNNNNNTFRLDDDGTTLGSFHDIQPRAIAAWSRWADQNDKKLIFDVPAILLSPPGSLGRLVYQSISSTADSNRWTESFRKKPLDIQILAWLHLLSFALLKKSSSENGDVARFLWNAITVLHNSPLPLAVRAKTTIRTYQLPLPIPLPKESPITQKEEGLVGRGVEELGGMARRAGVWDDWIRSLWETSSFPSTPTDIKDEVRNYLSNIASKSPETPAVYDLLSKLDQQQAKTRVPRTDPAAIVAQMLHLLNVLLNLGPANALLMKKVMAHLAQPNFEKLAKEDPVLAGNIVHLGKILHIQSLMTLAQMRRATNLFWTLLYPLTA